RRAGPASRSCGARTPAGSWRRSERSSASLRGSRASSARRPGLPSGHECRPLARDHAAPEPTLALAKADSLGRGRVQPLAWCSRPRSSTALPDGALVPLLELDGVEARYGQVAALHGVSLTVGEGEVVAVLGGNGAGKTTTLRAISGVVSSSGEIRFGGERIARPAPERVARLGIAHVPEGRGIFGELTVRENLRLGAYLRRDGFAEDYASIRGYFPWLEERADQQAGTLSG